mgnify:CR=1 FL=1
MGKRLDIVEEKFLNTVRDYNLIESGDVIVVGVSGGPDSITLLTCLNKYKEKFNYKIIVAHINHLIRKDSTDDEQFVENYCKKNDIPIFIKRAKVEEIAKKEKRGTEETGRRIRYEFFNDVLKKNNANKIAIAHNMNDNAETMILNLISPDQGQIFFQGQDVTHKNLPLLKNTGVLLEGSKNMFWSLSPIENFIYWGGQRGLNKKEATEKGLFLLKRFNLLVKKIQLLPN